MNPVHTFVRSNRAVNASTFGLASLWFPLSIVHLAQSGSHPNSFVFVFWLLSTAAFLAFWPLAIVKLMKELRISRLWAVSVFLPVALLIFALSTSWPTFTKFMLPLSMAAPWPFLLMNSRQESFFDSKKAGKHTE